ncbi:Phosphoribosylamine--glycine ligase [hydrothermal vent metagenome]|uniref:phosphoribosylamine--glycine ligase n=1 Tax=hydrothermal vent metagenome TaxID=652676 RepID=A0A3B1E759_9ZZZZ
MNVLIIGSGAREYSIALELKKSQNTQTIYFAPGNGATSNLGTNIDISDFQELANFSKNNNIELCIVGPEQPLVDGIVDVFKNNNLNIFGPSKKASKLEASKAYMKDFLKKYNIPTASYIQSSDKNKLVDFVNTFTTTPIVIKADGLCAGKGVIIATSKEEAISTIEDMLNGNKFADAGKRIIVEEFLDGYELSVFAICDGDNYKLFPAAQDHKRLLDKDKGPNTGGMGAYAPTPLVDDVLYEKIKQKILNPTMDGMKKENAPYFGVLFAGIMVVDNEPYLLEYNVRFGDPECEVLMPLLKSDALDMFYKASTNQLSSLQLEFYDKYSVGVVMSSKNYPYKSSPEEKITHNNQNKDKDTHISYAGVIQKNGELYSKGGRILVCVATCDTLQTARNKAYELCKSINFNGNFYRNDIAYRALSN